MVQASAQLDLTENKAWIGTWSDRILETVRILRVERGGPLPDGVFLDVELVDFQM